MPPLDPEPHFTGSLTRPYQTIEKMISVKFMLFVFLTILTESTTATPIRRGAVPLAYQVGHIVEHAYAPETADTNQQNAKLNAIQNRNRPETSLDQRHPVVEKPLMAQPPPYFMSEPKSTSTPFAGTTTTTTKPWQQQPVISNGPEAPSGEKLGQMLGLTPLDANAYPTEKSLEAFLAMLDETRDDDQTQTEANRNRKREQPKVPHPWNLPSGMAAILPSSSSTVKTTNVAAAAAAAPDDQQPSDWSVYDRLDTREPNQTAAVMESEQKFGYVVNGNDHQRFRVEGKSSNGLITGLFGFHHNNGNIRGVQYTADPSINPKFLYDTLMKFLSS